MKALMLENYPRSMVDVFIEVIEAEFITYWQ